MTDPLARERQQPAEYADASVIRTLAVGKHQDEAPCSRRSRPAQTVCGGPTLQELKKMPLCNMKPASTLLRELDDGTPLTISLKTLARRLDAHRSSVRRWLRKDGIRPIAMNDAQNSAIRYRWTDVERWIASRAVVD